MITVSTHVFTKRHGTSTSSVCWCNYRILFRTTSQGLVKRSKQSMQEERRYPGSHIRSGIFRKWNDYGRFSMSQTNNELLAQESEMRQFKGALDNVIPNKRSTTKAYSFVRSLVNLFTFQ